MSALSIASAAREAAGRVAVVAGGQEHTYAELAERAARVKTWLEREGASRVALVARPTVETLLAIYALLELGIPAAFIHPRLTPTERASLVDRYGGGAPVVVIDDAAAQLRDTVSLPPSTSEPVIDDEAPLGILFTSGTTGQPKGVVLSRRAFLASAAASAENFGWHDDDRWLLCMPAAHVGGLSVVVRCLVARRTVVLEPRFDPRETAATLARERVTIASFVPTMLARLLEVFPAYRAPASLRILMLGGAGTPARLLAAAAARDLPTITTYGMTETCSQVTTQRHGTPASSDVGSGEPLAGTSVRIVDERIEVRGPTLLSGFWGEPPLPRDAWFRTTDYGSFDEHGRLHVRGRVSERIVTGGENVDPAEVEAELERVPGIRAACVFGVADDVWGEVVCAALVPEPTAPPVDLAGLSVMLAPHKRPRRAAWLTELRVFPSGKLDRAGTRALAEPRLVVVGV